MARESFPPRSQRKRSFTTPPKAQDIKFYSEYVDPIDDFNWDPEKVLFGFTFYDQEQQDRSPAYQFLIEIENMDTGVIKNFVQLYNKPYYRFWQRQAETYTESPPEEEIDLAEEAIVNGKITVVPVNDFGPGETSVFFLPFRDLVWTRAKDNQAQQTFAVLKSNWHLYSETPEERNHRSKIMYIYLDVSENLIELDRTKLSQPEWYFDSLTDYKIINDRAYRWLVQGSEYKRLDRNGWHTSTQEEEQYITDLVQTMLPSYREHLIANELTPADPFVFKMAVENPQDNKDTIIIYLMKETRWQS